MLSVQEISDRLELQQLLTDYATAVDRRRFDDLHDLFTADAHIDYSAVGGAVGTPAEIVPWLRENLALFAAYYHLNANVDLHVDGDDAGGTVMCFNPMVFAGDEGAMLTVGVWYHDTYRRVDGRWRIASRVEEKCFMTSH
ncbi:MAG: nuclear transport factor 2 family protein [Gordonia paraffinivorans]